MGWPLCILRENAEDMIQTEREEQESEECTFLISSTKERSESIIESVVRCRSQTVSVRVQISVVRDKNIKSTLAFKKNII